VKLSQGVEWGLHCTSLVAQAPDGATRRVLSQHYGLPEAYLAKHLQALVRGGILSATPGPRGGFRLARPAEEVTVLEILEAIEGTAPAFVCREIRQQGTGAVPPEECTRPCGISVIMARADEAWRKSLAAVTVADLVALVPPQTLRRNQERLTGDPSTGR
jgi:Rrf2 family protein